MPLAGARPRVVPKPKTKEKSRAEPRVPRVALLANGPRAKPKPRPITPRPARAVTPPRTTPRTVTLPQTTPRVTAPRTTRTRKSAVQHLNSAPPGVVAAAGVEVGVRIRPFSRLEEEHGNAVVVSGEELTLLPDAENPVRFRFDHIMDSRTEVVEPTSQAEVYERLGARLTEAALSAYNCTAFAFGSTGTGKTHSVLGLHRNWERRGLLPRLLESVWAGLEEDAVLYSDLKVTVSYMEVYNEQVGTKICFVFCGVCRVVFCSQIWNTCHETQVFDLLSPDAHARNDSLNVRFSPKLGVFVDGLSAPECTRVEECMDLLDFGARMRAVSSTSLNEQSSRSHAIFSLHYERLRDKGGDEKFHQATIQVVDLAGREALGEEHGSRALAVERKSINQALFFLSKTVSEVSKRQEKEGNSMSGMSTLYRNSKLTLLLSHALSGNSRTSLLGTISPAASAHTETLGTLRFARTVKDIKLSARANESEGSKAALVEALKNQIAQLQVELQQEKTARVTVLGAARQMELASLSAAERVLQTQSDAGPKARATALNSLGLRPVFEEEEEEEEPFPASPMRLTVAEKERTRASSRLSLPALTRASCTYDEGESAMPVLTNVSWDIFQTGLLVFAVREPSISIGTAPGCDVRIPTSSFGDCEEVVHCRVSCAAAPEARPPWRVVVEVEQTPAVVALNEKKLMPGEKRALAQFDTLSLAMHHRKGALHLRLVMPEPSAKRTPHTEPWWARRPTVARSTRLMRGSRAEPAQEPPEDPRPPEPPPPGEDAALSVLLAKYAALEERCAALEAEMRARAVATQPAPPPSYSVISPRSISAPRVPPIPTASFPRVPRALSPRALSPRASPAPPYVAPRLLLHSVPISPVQTPRSLTVSLPGVSLVDIQGGRVTPRQSPRTYESRVTPRPSPRHVRSQYEPLSATQSAHSLPTQRTPRTDHEQQSFVVISPPMPGGSPSSRRSQPETISQMRANAWSAVGKVIGTMRATELGISHEGLAAVQADAHAMAHTPT